MLTVSNLYPAPVKIQGFAADDAFTTDAVTQTETVMGVDGNLSAGFVFNETPIRLVLMPDSTSYDVFENWRSAQNTAREVYLGSATISMPAVSRKYTIGKLILKSMPSFPPNRKTLQPIEIQMVAQNVVQEKTA